MVTMAQLLAHHWMPQAGTRIAKGAVNTPNHAGCRGPVSSQPRIPTATRQTKRARDHAAACRSTWTSHPPARCLAASAVGARAGHAAARRKRRGRPQPRETFRAGAQAAPRKSARAGSNAPRCTRSGGAFGGVPQPRFLLVEVVKLQRLACGHRRDRPRVVACPAVGLRVVERPADPQLGLEPGIATFERQPPFAGEAGIGALV